MGIILRLLAVLAFTSSPVWADEKLERECLPPQGREELIWLNGRQIESLNELETLYHNTYESGGRLDTRVYWEESEQSYVIPFRGDSLKISTKFIRSVIRHIELALERGYADAVIYHDLGHGHVLVEIGAPQAGLSLEQTLAQPETQVLYHSGELMRFRSGAAMSGQVTSDPWLAWRYHSRNFVAKNDGGDSLTVLFGGRNGYNTVRTIPGLREYVTFYMTATKNGCFKFKAKGEERFFDISFGIPPGTRP